MKRFYEEAMEYIAGTCLKSPEQALNEIADFKNFGRDATQEEVDEFTKYLYDNECMECEICGWYTYPGEYCDCYEENE